MQPTAKSAIPRPLNLPRRVYPTVRYSAYLEQLFKGVKVLRGPLRLVIVVQSHGVVEVGQVVTIEVKCLGPYACMARTHEHTRSIGVIPIGIVSRPRLSYMFYIRIFCVVVRMHIYFRYR